VSQQLEDLQEIEAGASEYPSLAYAPCKPAGPADWPWLLAWLFALAAAASHVLLGFGIVLSFAAPSESLGLLLVLLSILLGPLGVICSLLGIGFVRLHLSGWGMLLCVVTLPLNVFLSLLVFGIIPFEFYI
jgi:hypothetical protein